MSHSVVTTDQGKIQGRTQTNIDNQTFLAFYGIPYAKPPIGNLRFQDPQPPEKWSGVRDCTKEGASCYCDQFYMEDDGIKVIENGSEDCLFLNVFTPKSNSNKEEILKPVMVWIHGGGFTTGSSSVDIYGPEFLMTQEVVLVTFNYRLGALGFLSSPAQNIGNAGLKDQVCALRWVQRNISNFGGDPQNVTIFGESAGAASVQYLMLSPSTRGLIHRAIAQSGSALCTWARGRQNNAAELAGALGYEEEDCKKVMEFLQSLPVHKILEAQRQLGDDLHTGRLRYFCPVIEEESASAFLSEEPVNIIRSGRFNQIPYMTGYMSQEGLLLPLTARLGWPLSKFDFVPFFMGFNENDTNYARTKGEISRFYFGSDACDENNKTALYTVFSDALVVRGVFATARSLAVTSTHPVYLYEFTAETKLNDFKRLSDCSEPGASHFDDVFYLFKNSRTPILPPGSIENLTVRRTVKLWTNFARYGNPTPYADELFDNLMWKPVDRRQVNLMEIGITLSIDKKIKAERMEFWDQILKSFPGY